MSESGIRQAIVLVLALALALAATGCGNTEPRQAGGSVLGGDTTGDEATGGGGGSSGGGGSVSVGAAHAQGADRASARVGPAGGTLEIANGARVEIPPGAVGQPVEVTLTRAPATEAFNNREDERISGPAFIVSPRLESANGAKFVVSVPMTSVPDGFEQTDLAVAYETVSSEQRGLSEAMGSTQTRWEHSNAAVRSGRMSAELGELPGFRVQFVYSR